jgi:hypothetical protein
MDQKKIEDAERVVTVTLSRWKNEKSSEDVGDSNIRGITIASVGKCLLAFRVDDVKRESIDKHDAPKPITDYFLVNATLTVTPRPFESISMEELRANAVDSEIISQTYHVKHFENGTWHVMPDLDE